MPCIPIFIWFIKSISCLYKKAECVIQRGGKGRKECLCERRLLHGVFFTSENALSARQQINNPSMTKHSAIKTTEYGRKQSHISEMNLVQYLR